MQDKVFVITYSIKGNDRKRVAIQGVSKAEAMEMFKQTDIYKINMHDITLLHIEEDTGAKPHVIGEPNKHDCKEYYFKFFYGGNLKEAKIYGTDLKDAESILRMRFNHPEGVTIVEEVEINHTVNMNGKEYKLDVTKCRYHAYKEGSQYYEKNKLVSYCTAENRRCEDCVNCYFRKLAEKVKEGSDKTNEQIDAFIKDMTERLDVVEGLAKKKNEATPQEQYLYKSLEEQKDKFDKLQEEYDCLWNNYKTVHNSLDKTFNDKEQAYYERNQLVSFLSKIYPSYLAKHVDDKPSSEFEDIKNSSIKWDDEWRNIVVVNSPEGQLSWHIHDKEVVFFNHLDYNYEYKWDGHTTEEKYQRLLNVPYHLEFHAMRELAQVTVVEQEKIQVISDDEQEAISQREWHGTDERSITIVKDALDKMTTHKSYVNVTFKGETCGVLILTLENDYILYVAKPIVRSLGLNPAEIPHNLKDSTAKYSKDTILKFFVKLL